MCSKSNQVKGRKQARLGCELPCLSALLAEEVVRTIRGKVYYREYRISEEEWLELRRAVGRHCPRLLADLYGNDWITKGMARVCLLTFLGFRVKEVSVFMGTSIQSVSNMRQDACRLLFGDDTARTLRRHLEERYEQ